MLTGKQQQQQQESTKKEKAITYSWFGRINIVKMAVPSKEAYRFIAIPIKTPRVFFHRTRMNNSTICLETQKTLISKRNLEKEQNWRDQAS